MLYGVTFDFTEQTHTENDRAQAAALTESALVEKEELLKEVHHRVKNNLQVITSMVNLQASKVEDASARNLLEETRNRIFSIAAIHERLYQTSNFAAVKLLAYVRQIVPELVQFYGVRDRVQAILQGDDAMSLELARAVPFGLLLNELVSNALKHAFPEGREGIIRVTLSCTRNTYRMSIEDDGVGLPVGFDMRRVSSLGLKLARTLTHQLRGEIHFHTGGGTRAELAFPALEVERGSQAAEEIG